ncbi:hypothetical protein DIPPA_23558 [Diplonema papillatum]|nr:hypothetical protein DIPPA_23558 [Diplonema papillatum]
MPLRDVSGEDLTEAVIESGVGGEQRPVTLRVKAGAHVLVVADAGASEEEQAFEPFCGSVLGEAGALANGLVVTTEHGVSPRDADAAMHELVRAAWKGDPGTMDTVFQVISALPRERIVVFRFTAGQKAVTVDVPLCVPNALDGEAIRQSQINSDPLFAAVSAVNALVAESRAAWRKSAATGAKPAFDAGKLARDFKLDEAAFTAAVAKANAAPPKPPRTPLATNGDDAPPAERSFSSATVREPDKDTTCDAAVVESLRAALHASVLQGLFGALNAFVASEAPKQAGGLGRTREKPAVLAFVPGVAQPAAGGTPSESAHRLLLNVFADAFHGTWVAGTLKASQETFRAEGVTYPKGLEDAETECLREALASEKFGLLKTLDGAVSTDELLAALKGNCTASTKQLPLPDEIPEICMDSPGAAGGALGSRRNSTVGAPCSPLLLEPKSTKARSRPGSPLPGGASKSSFPETSPFLDAARVPGSSSKPDQPTSPLNLLSRSPTPSARLLDPPPRKPPLSAALKKRQDAVHFTKPARAGDPPPALLVNRYSPSLHAVVYPAAHLAEALRCPASVLAAMKAAEKDAEPFLPPKKPAGGQQSAAARVSALLGSASGSDRLCVVPRDGCAKAVVCSFKAAQRMGRGGFDLVLSHKDLGKYKPILWVKAAAAAKPAPPSAGSPASRFGAPPRGRGPPPDEKEEAPIFKKFARAQPEAPPQKPGGAPGPAGPAGLTPQQVEKMLADARPPGGSFMVGKKHWVFLKRDAVAALERATDAKRSAVVAVVQAFARGRASKNVYKGKRIVPIQREVRRYLCRKAALRRKHEAQREALAADHLAGADGVASDGQLERERVFRAFAAPLPAFYRKTVVMLQKTELLRRMEYLDTELAGRTTIVFLADEDKRQIQTVVAEKARRAALSRRKLMAAFLDHEHGSRHRLAWDEENERNALMRFHREETRAYRRAVRKHEKKQEGLRRSLELQLIMRAQSVPHTAHVPRHTTSSSPLHLIETATATGGPYSPNRESLFTPPRTR